jgi:hypothetical protein
MQLCEMTFALDVLLDVGDVMTRELVVLPVMEALNLYCCSLYLTLVISYQNTSSQSHASFLFTVIGRGNNKHAPRVSPC